jgi:hypothetical protein
MISVTIAKKAPASPRGLEEHAISPRVWRAIGDAMLHNVNINTWTKTFVETFTSSALNDFICREIYAVRPFAVKKRGGNPNLICDFELGKDFLLHRYLLTMNLHLYKVLYKIQDSCQEKSRVAPLDCHLIWNL